MKLSSRKMGEEKKNYYTKKSQLTKGVSWARGEQVGICKTETQHNVKMEETHARDKMQTRPTGNV